MKLSLKLITCVFFFFPVLIFLPYGCSIEREAIHTGINSLNAGFKNPPDSTKPGVYWYFMEGNVSRAGMTKDLESMKEAGIGSVVFLEVNVGVPVGPVEFFSEEWQELFVHAVEECERLGIEMSLGVGPGWTGSGGPWVSAKQSMKHLVSSSIQVSASDKNILLPLPVPEKPYFGEGGFTPALKKQRLEFYEDVAVLAFPTPSNEQKIKNVDEKALYYRPPYTSVEGTVPFFPSKKEYADSWEGSAIAQKDIIDLSHLLREDGTLDWDPPAGNWTIMRFGSRNNGSITRPAPKPGLGFEADKFDTLAIRDHLDHYVGELIREIGTLDIASSGGLKMLHLDSWEMGAQNWTANFREEFKKRRGYDPQPFYPVYAGYIVGDIEKSERFLWDLRQTSQKLILENHASYIKDYAHQHGLGLSIEPYDMNPTADMELGYIADVVMAEFWSDGFGFFNSSFAVIEAASVAHIKGQKVVPAEAFTAGKAEGFKKYPGSMKNQGDWAFAGGVNKMVYHTFQHQPLDDQLKPGMTMGPYGVHWDRNQTWWPMVKGYHDYISRSQYLLQQGRTVADILYLTPEGAPHVFRPPPTALEGDPFLPDRKGYNFDGIAPSELSNAKVENNKIVFPSGATYRILVLPFSHTMTAELLTEIRTLVRGGAIVMGVPPERSPSLTNYRDSDHEITEMVKEIWGSNDVPSIQKEQSIGEGKIIWGGKIDFAENDYTLYPGYDITAKVLEQMGVPVDFESTGEVRYTHRTAPDWDIYFIANRTDAEINTICTFRSAKGIPQLWNPVTGKIRALPEYSKTRKQTRIPIAFGPFESFFVVFSKGKAGHISFSSENFPELKELVTLTGPWNVSFQPDWGGPGNIIFDELQDWSLHPDEGIKYYSGIATYTEDFDLPQKAAAVEDNKRRIYLELGEVKNMARVRLNGQAIGIVWTNNRLDITDYVKKENNHLQVKVANSWVNRLIGDQRLYDDDGIKEGKWPEWLLKDEERPNDRFTFATYQHYEADNPLLESGLLGPVKILVATESNAQASKSLRPMLRDVRRSGQSMH